jgi:hypothetical protein
VQDGAQVVDAPRVGDRCGPLVDGQGAEREVSVTLFRGRAATVVRAADGRQGRLGVLRDARIEG